MTAQQAENVKIADLVLDTERVQIRATVARETVDRYVDSLEYLPPIIVFRIKDTETPAEVKARGAEIAVKIIRLVVADGFHRVAAYKAKKQTEIPAFVRDGTWQDAEEFNAVANSTSGRALTISERNAAVRRILRLNKAMTQAAIASRLSMSQPAVSKILRMDKLRSEHPQAASLSDAHLDEILALDRAAIGPVVDAAEKNQWTRAQTRTAASNMRDARIDKSTRAEILAGAIEPVKVKSDGTFDRQAPGAEDADGSGGWDGTRVALALLADARAIDVVDEISADLIERAIDRLSEARDIAAERAASSEASAPADGGAAS